MRKAYYNENDPAAAKWLRELISLGLIAPGDVDQRSIVEVMPDDLRGYTQCHFFAGIGGWSLALRLANWPDNRPVWTGSCPCQPFSRNGRNKGGKDHRDLWPIFLRLIADCRPAKVFGEQTSSAITFGWLDRLCDDLEEIDYAIGAAVLPACSVGAPHERERLWWVADAEYGRLAVRRGTSPAVETLRERERISRPVAPRLPVETSEVVESRRVARIAAWEAQSLPVSVVDGISAGVGSAIRSRGYGNAIVPQVAAEFILAALPAPANGGAK